MAIAATHDVATLGASVRGRRKTSVISLASRAGMRVRASLWLVFCHACAVDATVYRSVPRAGGGAGAGAAGSAEEAGASAQPGSDTPSAVYGCGAEDRGGAAILADIVARLHQDLLVPGSSCATDSDCSQTFITPICNVTTAMCERCPDPAQQSLFGVALSSCLVGAAHSCCRDPDAPPDCLVRACMIGCGAQ